MSPTFLTMAEVDQLCHPLRQAAAQCRWLTAQGIPFRRSPSGRPLILRAAVDQIVQVPSMFMNEQPDMGALLDAIRAKRQARQRPSAR